MWDSNSPLQLLNSMPEKLDEEHLMKLQMLFEADKYKNQLIYGGDICGTYAPFCVGCNKEGKYPCAVAYVNAMKAQGMNVTLAFDEEPSKDEAVGLYGEQGDAVKKDDVNDESFADARKDEQKPSQTKIRIAIARKKIL